MGTTRNVDMSANNDQVKIVENPDLEQTTATETSEATATTPEEAKEVKKARPTRGRSARYQARRAQVDKTKTYDAFAAIELIKRLSYSSFDGTIVAHLLLREKGESATLSLPHSTGKRVKVAIVDDALLEKIAAGDIDFDVLVSTKEFMPKLTKHARVLGPRGLMPNPKSGTLTSNPEAKKKELEGGKMTIKTEKKQPVMHVTVGKVSMPTKELVENIQALLKALKGKVVRLSIAASMSPSVKVEVE